MNQSSCFSIFSRSLVLLTIAGLIAGSAAAVAADLAVTLTGAQEVPPNTSAAGGSGQIVVMPDGAVSGTITVTGMTPTAAHIHGGATGRNGPVIVKLERTETGFAVPAGARFSEAQLVDFNAGNTYINVHSETYPPGEIRGQLLPPAAQARPVQGY